LGRGEADVLEACQDALVALKQGDPAAARGHANEALKAEPENPRALILLGRAALAEGKFGEAEEQIRKAMRVAPDDASMSVFLGDVFFHQRNFREAAFRYTEAFAKQPNPDLQLKMLFCDVGRTDFTSATSTLMKFDAFDDPHPGYYLGKAAIARGRGEEESRRGREDSAAKLHLEAESALHSARTRIGNEAMAPYVQLYLVLFPSTKAASLPAGLAAPAAAGIPAAQPGPVQTQ